MTKQEKIVEMAVELAMQITRLARKPIVTRRAGFMVQEFKDAVEALKEPATKKAKKE